MIKELKYCNVSFNFHKLLFLSNDDRIMSFSSTGTFVTHDFSQHSKTYNTLFPLIGDETESVSKKIKGIILMSSFFKNCYELRKDKFRVLL